MDTQEKYSRYRFADLHCHPNLKTFGHFFSSGSGIRHQRSDVWFFKKPSGVTRILNAITGLTKFSQADFTTLARANVKIAFVSLYPFEKGFFINGPLNGPLSAQFANLITSVGYRRIRHLQRHTDYFEDLSQEYNFLIQSKKVSKVDGIEKEWVITGSWAEVENLLSDDHKIAVILTIEGAHILNTGLEKYGKKTDAEEVLMNIHRLKQWEYPPLFITFAHNFNNDLCGHARSLDPLGPLVDQSDHLNLGFSALGYHVVKALLDHNPRQILIDIKHMSVQARKEYFQLIDREYKNRIPIIVSHGAVTGIDFKGRHHGSIPATHFCQDDINFFDEELVHIARTAGLFGLQLDGNRLAPAKMLKKSLIHANKPDAIKHSAKIIWKQLQHIAEVLDQNQMFAWGIACIGSDFDGTINPLNGIWTSEQLPSLTDELLILADQFLKRNHILSLKENKAISPEEIVFNFIFNNAVRFLEKNFRK